MTCKEFEPFLYAYVDGEFEGPELDDAKVHLNECAACRSRVEYEKAFKRRLRNSFQNHSLASSPNALRAKVCACIAREPVPQKYAYHRRVLLVAPLGVAAACVVAYFVVPNNGGKQIEAVVTASIAHHQGQFPLDVQDAQVGRIRSWLQGKIDFAPSRIPEIRNANLLGVRLSYLNGRPAAYVVYDSSDQRRVSLFVFDSPDLIVNGSKKIANRDVLLANQRGYNVALWKDQEIVYSLVSDLDEQDILKLVKASYQQEKSKKP